MTGQIKGIHHVTAICGDPQKNVDFYCGVLGLRFIKRTVNYDDPHTYHLYYGDAAGTPGSAITFFSWPQAPRGRVGIGQFHAVAFSVPVDALSFWKERLESRGISVKGPIARYMENYLSFRDPDGITLELVGRDKPSDHFVPWVTKEIGEDVAIRGFDGVTLVVDRYDRTLDFLNQPLQFRFLAEEDGSMRYVVDYDVPASIVDVQAHAERSIGRYGVGTVHHVAFGVRDESVQAEVRERTMQSGANVSPVMNRTYFRSIYFREPGGALIEMATMGPGFDADEPREELGRKLCLPDSLEYLRAELERELPALRIPWE